MHFVVYALDKAGAAGLRAAHRDAHRHRLRNHDHPVKVIAAGPLLDAKETAIGSLIIIEADAKAAVDAFKAADPYVLNKLYATIDIRPFAWTIGAPPPA